MTVKLKSVEMIGLVIAVVGVVAYILFGVLPRLSAEQPGAAPSPAPLTAALYREYANPDRRPDTGKS